MIAEHYFNEDVYANHQTLAYIERDLLGYVDVALFKDSDYRLENKLLDYSDQQIVSLVSTLLLSESYSPNNKLHDAVMNIIGYFHLKKKLTPKQRLVIHTHIKLNCEFFKGGD